MHHRLIHCCKGEFPQQQVTASTCTRECLAIRVVDYEISNFSFQQIALQPIGARAALSNLLLQVRVPTVTRYHHNLNSRGSYHLD